MANLKVSRLRVSEVPRHQSTCGVLARLTVCDVLHTVGIRFMRTTFINAGWPLKAVLGEKEVGSFLRRSLRDFQPPINMWGGGVGKINCFQCPSHGWHQIHENSFHHRRQEQASLITLGKGWRCKSDQKELPPSGQSRGGQS